MRVRAVQASVTAGQEKWGASTASNDGSGGGETRGRRRGRGGTGRGRVLMEQCFCDLFFFNSCFFILFCCSLAGLVNCCVNAGCDWDRVVKIFVRVVKGA